MSRKCKHGCVTDSEFNPTENCKGCGETICAQCFAGGKGLCEDCLTEGAPKG